MTLREKLVAPLNALVLLGCAFFAGSDTLGIAFAMGESPGGGQVDLAAGTLLIGTLAGGVGLIIAALGSWTRRPSVSVIALVSVLVVLPEAVLYSWQNTQASVTNTKLGMHYSLWAWTSDILPSVLCLGAGALSWIRLRKSRQV